MATEAFLISVEKSKNNKFNHSSLNIMTFMCMSRICFNCKITLLQNTPEPVDWLDYCCHKDEFSLSEKHMYQIKNI